VQVTAADRVGHQTTSTCDYAVEYDFGGFEPPLVAHGPRLPSQPAGHDVPVQFSLSGDHGLDVISAGSPTWLPLDCDTLAPTGAVVEAVAAAPLTYNPRRDLYTYEWPTERSWRGTCVRFELSLDDGTTHGVDLALR
jgi:hypothetical protein